MKIRFRTVDSIADELEAVQKRIAARALQLFRDRGAAWGKAVDDWLAAEQETIWRPSMEVLRTKDAFVVRIAVAGVAPSQLNLRVTPGELLLTAELHHTHEDDEGEPLVCEFASGPLFRSYQFAAPVDPDRVTAECRNGLLQIVAPLAQPGRKVQVAA
jgi:HSP20 family molecular chaperone IbpA